MKKFDDYIRRAMMVFEGSFINHNYELILNRQYNIYFRLEDVETEHDFKCKMLWWVSRSACEGISEYRQNKIRESLNRFLGVEFSKANWMCIYCKLGNKVNSNLTNEFIESGYDLSVLNKGCDLECIGRNEC